jgi:hypothetical protein
MQRLLRASVAPLNNCCVSTAHTAADTDENTTNSPSPCSDLAPRTR